MGKGNIMTERLQYAFEIAQKLPDAAQNALADHILEEIEELEWDEIVHKPEVQTRLGDLARQALAEDKAGKTEVGGFDCL
jgi:hypothetical protein